MKTSNKIWIVFLNRIQPTLTGFRTLLGLMCLIIIPTTTASGQVNTIVDLSKKSMYVQEPFRVNITVYTTTWFTAPVEFGNLQIPSTFIIPFDETRPGMFTVGKKQYPGIQFYYIVFPYKPGEFTVPSFEITATSPPEGSSESRKVVLHTQPQSFTVRDVPKNLKTDTWLVARDVQINDSWNPKPDNLKVGDVLQRTVTINAQGTLPQFIPNVSSQMMGNGVSTYPKDPVLSDSKPDGNVNGQSMQSVTYLLEKPGDITIPEIHLSFWNPYTGKMQERVLAGKSLHVAENPDLGIITTLKDSLQQTLDSSSVHEKAKVTPHILGLPWYSFVGLLVLTLVLLYFLFKIGLKEYQKYRHRMLVYKLSEPYLFKQLLRADDKSLLNVLYAWWDSMEYRPSASVGFSLDFLGESKDATELKKQLIDYYLSGKINLADFKNLIKELRTKTLSARQNDNRINEEQML